MQHTPIHGQVTATVLQRTHCTRQRGATNGEVARTAEKRFRACPYVALRSIMCEFHEGVLVLRGQVTSYYLKQLAQEMVRTLDGVELIVNVVEVKEHANGSSWGTAAGWL